MTASFSTSHRPGETQLFDRCLDILHKPEFKKQLSSQQEIQELGNDPVRILRHRLFGQAKTGDMEKNGRRGRRRGR